MPILWGYECRPIGGAICIPSSANKGCEVVGDVCYDHQAAQNDKKAPKKPKKQEMATAEDAQYQERISRAEEIQHLYETGQICKFD